MGADLRRVEPLLGAGPGHRGGAGELSPPHSSRLVGDQFHRPQRLSVLSPHNRVRHRAAIKGQLPDTGFGFWACGNKERKLINDQTYVSIRKSLGMLS